MLTLGDGSPCLQVAPSARGAPVGVSLPWLDGMNLHGQARLQEPEKVIPALDRRGCGIAPEYGTVREVIRGKGLAVRVIVIREGLFEDDNALDTCITQLLG